MGQGGGCPHFVDDSEVDCPQAGSIGFVFSPCIGGVAQVLDPESAGKVIAAAARHYQQGNIPFHTLVRIACNGPDSAQYGVNIGVLH